MSPHPDEPSGRELTRKALRTPRSAAVAGIAFSLLFGFGLILIRSSIPADPRDAGDWLADSSSRGAVLAGITLVPFAGIAFLWFIAVVRDRVGEAEDRFFATVFLGSGLLFVAMLFVAAAMATGLVASAGEGDRGLVASEAWTIGRHTTYALMTIFAMRMAAVFTIAASTILRRTGAGPRWLALTGYAIAVVMLVSVGFFAWIELLFPAWVLAVSVTMLVTGPRRDPAG